MRVVGGPIEWIDQPGIELGSLGSVTGEKRRFLADKSMVRKALHDRRRDQFLGGAVGIGDEIDCSLEVDLPVERQPLAQNRARRLGGLDRKLARSIGNRTVRHLFILLGYVRPLGSSVKSPE